MVACDFIACSANVLIDPNKQGGSGNFSQIRLTYERNLTTEMIKIKLL